MEKIVITGASGDLSRRVAEILKTRAGAENLILVSRTPDALRGVADAGADVRFGDYDDPASLEAAFQGGSILFLVSGLAINRRVEQHRNAIEAARKAGIKQIIYTSTAGVHPKNPTLSAKEHIQTEADLRDSGLPHTVLRNATYADVVATLMLTPVLETGKWEQIEGGGALAPVAKQDIANCLAACLLDPAAHAGAVYEISGPELLTFADIARIASDVHGVPIDYVPVTVEERYAYFDALGVPRSYEDGMMHAQTDAWPSDEMVSASLSMAQGFHAIMSHHVKQITGKPATPLRAVMELAKGKSYGDF